MRSAGFALDALEMVASSKMSHEGVALDAADLRFGMHCGPVIGNVVGARNPRYSVFGDTVSMALWMADNSDAGKLQCSRTAPARLLRFRRRCAVRARR